ncbi:hypothetical protein BJ912DRAFT_649164 [Pholiota molesta]|nr:hypothetical protein BJ912DRAFT_649164 [Pholiota molesta]
MYRRLDWYHLHHLSITEQTTAPMAATSRQTVQIIESGLGSKDLEANLSEPGIRSTAVAGRGAAARMFSCVGNFDAVCFFVALCGLWTNAFLHALLVLSYLAQSAPNHECESCPVVEQIKYTLRISSTSRQRYVGHLLSFSGESSHYRCIRSDTRVELLRLGIFRARALVGAPRRKLRRR